MNFEYAPGSTPLDPDESEGLIPSHITTQGQLNEWEAANILEAETWLFTTTSHGNFLTIEFVKLIHEHMFDNTWKWAGTFRSSQKNIGVASFNITTEMNNLLEDIKHRIINCSTDDITIYNQSIDNIACRFHHRLASIHPFPNGNGRHARLITDFLLTQAGRPRFTWGETNLIESSPTRDQYITALKNADKHDYRCLEAFVRS